MEKGHKRSPIDLAVCLLSLMVVVWNLYDCIRHIRQILNILPLIDEIALIISFSFISLSFLINKKNMARSGYIIMALYHAVFAAYRLAQLGNNYWMKIELVGFGLIIIYWTFLFLSSLKNKPQLIMFALVANITRLIISAYLSYIRPTPLISNVFVNYQYLSVPQLIIDVVYILIAVLLLLKKDENRSSTEHKINMKGMNTMLEMFPCGLFQPPGIKVFGISDSAVIYGKEQIPFSAVSSIALVTAPTPLTNGIGQMVHNGKVYQLCYKFADRERAASAIGYAKEKIEAAHGLSKNYKYCLNAHTGTTLEVYETYLVLNHVRTGGLNTLTANVLTGGSTGGKRINFMDITAIQFKEPAGVTVGFIQFAYPGSGEARGGVIDAINDENAIPVSPQNYAQAREIVDYIENKRVALRAPQPTVIQQSSSADEIKKFKELLDLGIITQEEFDAKKKQLLGL